MFYLRYLFQPMSNFHLNLGIMISVDNGFKKSLTGPKMESLNKK
jgi:hypothetical protein